jgi:alkylated DNA repair dioxygenase AlkB
MEDRPEPMPSRRPRYPEKRNSVIDDDLVAILPDTEGVGMIAVMYDALSESELERYINKAINVEREEGTTAYAASKPRREVCYTRDGVPYEYSKKKHLTRKYPKHVLRAMRKIKESLNERLNIAIEGEEDTAVDIVYDSKYPRGGSIAAHSDDEKEWKAIVVLSLGQTRYMRIKHKTDKTIKIINVKMRHNSVLVMLGSSVQEEYTHQVDKLSEKEEIGMRMSLNVRYI